MNTIASKSGIPPLGCRRRCYGTYVLAACRPNPTGGARGGFSFTALRSPRRPICPCHPAGRPSARMYAHTPARKEDAHMATPVLLLHTCRADAYATSDGPFHPSYHLVAAPACLRAPPPTRARAHTPWRARKTGTGDAELPCPVLPCRPAVSHCYPILCSSAPVVANGARRCPTLRLTPYVGRPVSFLIVLRACDGRPRLASGTLALHGCHQLVTIPPRRRIRQSSLHAASCLKRDPSDATSSFGVSTIEGPPKREHPRPQMFQ